MSTFYINSKSPLSKGVPMRELYMASQRGAVLLVSMIMLLLITVVGVSAIGISSLDTKMTANSRDRQIAFHAAESGLREAESIVLNSGILDEGVTTGYFVDQVDQWWSTVDDAWWTNNAQSVGAYTGQTPPLYVVELTTIGRGDAGNKQQSLSDDTDFKTLYYTITSEGEGPGGSNVQLQSVYARRVDKIDWAKNNDSIPEGKFYEYQ